jgi:hypothetical protein
MALKGDAQYFIMNVDDWRIISYRHICILLEERFGVSRNLASNKRRLTNRRKQKEETWQHMAEDMLRLSKTVYAGAPELSEREARDAFIKALPENLRFSIAAANPTRLSDCVNNVTQLCALVNIDEEETSSQKVCNIKYSSNNDGGPQHAYQNPSPGPNPNQQNDGYNPRNNPYNRRRKMDMSKVECYRCHEMGHMARECKMPFDQIQKDKYYKKDWNKPSNNNPNHNDNDHSENQQESQ